MKKGGGKGPVKPWQPSVLYGDGAKSIQYKLIR